MGNGSARLLTCVMQVTRCKHALHTCLSAFMHHDVACTIQLYLPSQNVCTDREQIAAVWRELGKACTGNLTPPAWESTAHGLAERPCVIACKQLWDHDRKEGIAAPHLS